MKRTLWVPLDVNFWHDPDVLACSFGAQVLFIRSLCLVKQTGSNGLVSKTLLVQLASDMPSRGLDFASELCAHNLWRDDGDAYAIPSWAKHNRSRSEREELSQIRAESGRRGGQASGRTRAKQNGSNLVHEQPSRGLPPNEAEKSREEKSEGRASARTPSRGTRIPDPFDVTDAMVAWATEQHPAVKWPAETEKFLDYWRGRSGAAGVKVDWVATWRNWIRRAAEGVR